MENSVARKGFENLLPQYRIDGFNPNDVLTMIEDVDENGQPAELRRRIRRFFFSR